MSASLVGSEMCIRDSVFAAFRPCHRAAQPPRQSPGRATWCTSHPWGHRNCLLYTSDAADDM
eukprot:1408006-Alexandrium_andersonii.AAC.1